MLEINKISMSNLKDVIRLFINAYELERYHVSSLPEFDNIKEFAEKRIKGMLMNHEGYIAFRDNKVVGYMTYVLGGPLFGNSECALVPLFGHASVEQDKYRIYQALYNEASKDWLLNKKLSWVIRLFEHDQILEKFCFKNGFGQRCVDAVAPIEYEKMDYGNIMIKKATDENINDIAVLHQLHASYYKTAPLCMPNYDEDAYESLKASFEDLSTRIWIAYLNNNAVGYTCLVDVGESFISLSRNMLSINSMFVDPSTRGLGIGAKLLNEVKRYINEYPEYQSYGVDYESINPLGLSFWEKHFTPYTKTVTRRIDEGILKKVD